MVGRAPGPRRRPGAGIWATATAVRA